MDTLLQYENWSEGRVQSHSAWTGNKCVEWHKFSLVLSVSVNDRKVSVSIPFGASDAC